MYQLPNHPVVGVMWYEAYAFTKWLSSYVMPVEEGWVPGRDPDSICRMNPNGKRQHEGGYAGARQRLGYHHYMELNGLGSVAVLGLEKNAIAVDGGIPGAKR